MSVPLIPPQTEGVYSKQAHADLPLSSEGRRTYERELGQSGFSGLSTHMHHTHAPTAWASIAGALRPRAFDLLKLERRAKDLTPLIASEHVSPWVVPSFLSNQDVDIRFWHLTDSMKGLARDADGDLLFFVHEGAGELFCDYGHMAMRDGDYVVIPRGTQWRISITTPMKILMIEAIDSHFELPDKGILGAHAIFDPAVLERPIINQSFKDQYDNQTHWDVYVKRRGDVSVISYAFNPLDAIGWHGTLMPVKLNWRDLRPVMSDRYHIPPSVHTVFVARDFVVTTFCPRPIESDPGALKVPFYHNNDDYDEFIFYHQGQFFSRDNIKPGMATLHPAGITHGPHPGAFAVGATHTRAATDEVALMIDTRNALCVSESMCAEAEDITYVHSWKGIQRP
jgi:homogentisate 1,2-dioxygenase